jgi:hypothetical protein
MIFDLFLVLPLSDLRVLRGEPLPHEYNFLLPQRTLRNGLIVVDQPFDTILQEIRMKVDQ